MVDSSPPRMRLDKWLWAARFFKTRQLAHEAIEGGKVHLNGARTKPSKEVSVGSRITISKEGYHWEIEVLGLTTQRRPAKEAILLYSESPDSQAKRQEAVALRRQQAALQGGEQRPTKKQRRMIHKFKRSME